MEERIIHDRIPVMASYYSNPRENDAVSTETRSKHGWRYLRFTIYGRIYIDLYSIFHFSFIILHFPLSKKKQISLEEVRTCDFTILRAKE